MNRIASYFRSLPKNLSLLLIIIVTMVGLWMFITPFYLWIVETYSITPIASILLGLVIVFIATKLWKLKLW